MLETIMVARRRFVFAASSIALLLRYLALTCSGSYSFVAPRQRLDVERVGQRLSSFCNVQRRQRHVLHATKQRESAFGTDDPWEVFELDRGNSSEADIKARYRQLARVEHPDVSMELDAEIRWFEITEAYTKLQDDEWRMADEDGLEDPFAVDKQEMSAEERNLKDALDNASPEYKAKLRRMFCQDWMDSAPQLDSAKAGELSAGKKQLTDRVSSFYNPSAQGDKAKLEKVRLDGLWVSEAGDSLNIEDLVVTFPQFKAGLKASGDGHDYEMELFGKLYYADLLPGKLVWNHGDVWELQDVWKQEEKYGSDPRPRDPSLNHWQ